MPYLTNESTRKNRVIGGSSSLLRISKHTRDLLPVAKRAFMDGESDSSLGGSKAGGGSTRDRNRTLTQAEDEGPASTIRRAVWRGNALLESGPSVPSDRLALAGRSGRRAERAGAEARGGTSRRGSAAAACAAPVLAGGRVGRPPCYSGSRSPFAAG